MVIDSVEIRREREFFRYWEPIRALSASDPVYCDLHNATAVEQHVASPSPDRALTAFCQLGAVRLGTKRCLLFFFDTRHAYILAEATKTIPLSDLPPEDPNEALWLGYSLIPRGFTVCEHTVMLPAAATLGPEARSQRSIKIINDLSENAQFRERPYVLGGPRARFYAGVPITTPGGINIGAYCVLDGQPRNGLSADEIAFLFDMADTVMVHLDIARAKSEHLRGLQMVNSLSKFVGHASDEREHNVRAARTNRLRQVSRPSMPTYFTQPDDHVRSNRDQRSAANEILYDASRPTASQTNPESARPKEIPEQNEDRINGQSNLPVADTTMPPTSSSEVDDLRDAIVPVSVRASYQRAARFMREATDTNGVLFLDASITSYSGLVSAAAVEEEYDASNISDGEDTSDEPSISATSPGEEHEWDSPAKPCYVLGSSTLADESESVSDGRPRIGAITENFLKSILRRHRRGKIWNFDEQVDPDATESNDSMTTSSPPRHRRRSIRHREAAVIQRLFPRARSVIILGLRDDNAEKWCAACVVWTYHPMRVFSNRNDMNYISAFCDVVMAETRRLEAQTSATIKSDFVASISHELRSPLHGILGSVECLQGLELSDALSHEVGQIESCGRTLLDIVDHLLDFSSINHLAPRPATATRGDIAESSSNSKRRPDDLFSPAKRPRGTTSQTVDVSMSEVTEEVIGTVVYSFTCASNRETMLSRDVDLILDIEHPRDSVWNCQLPIGAWKRICMNLVNNALKYTVRGHVAINLSVVPPPEGRGPVWAVLKVADSGRGMSQNYLKNHVFKAFSQEDSLAEGTGLGMSLVAKITARLGGHVDVQSTQGIGTCVTVSVPLQADFSTPISPVESESFGIHSLMVGIVPSSTSESTSASSPQDLPNHDLLLATLHKACSQLGLDPRQSLWPPAEDCDLYIIHESVAFQIALAQARSPSSAAPRRICTKPIVLVCRNFYSERDLKARLQSTSNLTTGPIEYLTQPCAPFCLAKVIRRCLPAPSSPTGYPTASRQTADCSLQSPVRAPLLREETNSTMASARESSRGGSPTLPADPEMRSRAHSPTSRSSHTAQRLTSGQMLVLVDDNKINLRLLQTFARNNGHRCILATNGREAVDAYINYAFPSDGQPRQEEHGGLPPSPRSPPSIVDPPVVLMDINMPVMDGFEATRQIRALEHAHDAPPATIIALTGLGSAAAQQEARGSGMDLFLTKPVRLKELKDILARVDAPSNSGEARR